MKNSYLCVILLVNIAVLSAAQDFGVIADQTAGYGGIENGHKADYTGVFIPRISFLTGSRGDVYVSGGLIIQYENEQWTFTPELLRTEFSLVLDLADLRAGRMYYADPLGLIAEGLFDGAKVSLNTAAGTFSAGAWYTGLLYKKRADIAMTQEEQQAFFDDTYFAPRRLVSALEWEHLSVGGPLRAKAALIGQFDLSGDNRLHSQYLAGKFTLPFGASALDLGGCVELIEAEETFAAAFAAEVGIQLALPAGLPDRLSLLCRYSSEGNENNITAFLPITSKSMGEVLKIKLSGISLITLDYTVRLHPVFSIGAASTCFIRSGLETYRLYPLDPLGENGSGHFLGNEFFGRLMWHPFSDVQFNLGGGAFLPSLGNAAPDAGVLWRTELNVVLSL